MKHAPAFLKLVDEAKTHIRETNPQEVKKRLDAHETFKLIDVREESEWAKGHLPGAIHLCKGTIERDIENAVPGKATPIVLYCGGGFRSALAADNLQKMGYTNVISMDGGWRGWADAGFPTVKD
ncbi:MAG TPA: rhodanese-like domain-containing protein [Terriglobia bacterium]|nr:rhodanese-like domain-containing protein [Terriglobia bacterium]